MIAIANPPRSTCPHCGATNTLIRTRDAYGGCIDCMMCGYHLDVDEQGAPFVPLSRKIGGRPRRGGKALG